MAQDNTYTYRVLVDDDRADGDVEVDIVTLTGNTKIRKRNFRRYLKKRGFASCSHYKIIKQLGFRDLL